MAAGEMLTVWQAPELARGPLCPRHSVSVSVFLQGKGGGGGDKTERRRKFEISSAESFNFNLGLDTNDIHAQLEEGGSPTKDSGNTAMFGSQHLCPPPSQKPTVQFILQMCVPQKTKEGENFIRFDTLTKGGGGHKIQVFCRRAKWMVPFCAEPFDNSRRRAMSSLLFGAKDSLSK